MENGTPNNAVKTLWPMIAVALILLVLITMGIRGFIQARSRPSEISCLSHLKQIDGAVQMWALENKLAGTNTVTLLQVKDYLKGSLLPVCPQGGIYTVSTVSSSPTCSLTLLGLSL